MTVEISRQQEQQLRRMGREAVAKAIKAANEGTGGMRRVTAKVTKVNSDYTVDVDMGDSQFSMPITGLRYTTACCGVRVGDTVLVDVVGHLATVTGILATADNGPYVDLDKRYARLSQVPNVKAGWIFIGSLAQQSATQASATHNLGTTQYAVTFGLWGEASHWTWIRQTVIDQSENSFTIRVYNDNSNGVTVTGIWIYWVAVSFAMMG